MRAFANYDTDTVPFGCHNVRILFLNNGRSEFLGFIAQWEPIITFINQILLKVKIIIRIYGKL